MKFVSIQLINMIPSIALSVVIFCMFIFAGNIFFLIYKKRIIAKTNDKTLFLLLGRILKGIFFIVGLITSLGTLGVDVSALVAGIGLSGFAITFATKDILSNLISGILILIYKPFQVNDSIEVDKYNGQVKEINLRYTVISNENKDILIPNSLLYSKPVSVAKLN